MKIRQLILLTPMLLSMVACNGDKASYAGRYSFQLGSDTGTHAGIHLTLTDEIVPNTEKETKKFSLQFDVSGSAGAGIFNSISNIGGILEALSASTDYNIDNIEESFDDVIETGESIVSEATSEPIVIEGYYYTQEIDKVNHLLMGISLDEFDVKISEDLVEKVMFATISGDTVNVTIPVSIKDFLFQLYWYGYRVAGLDSLLEPVDLIPEYDSWHDHHAIGSHPSEEDVLTIKKHQETRHQRHVDGIEDNPKYEIGEEIYREYRDYHTLTMGLAKNGKK